jgi:hypothetical protein
MQGAGWIDLFRRVPADLHDSLALGMSTGFEIVVQQLLRLDDEFMVLRGRTSGTNDGGRIMILPYGHLVSIAFNRRLAATEVEKIFGASQFTPLRNEDGEIVEAAPEPAEAPKAAPPEKPAPAEKPAAAGPAKPLSKSILLARLRERLADKAK